MITRIGVETAWAGGLLIGLALSVGSPQAILGQTATRMTEAEAVAKLDSGDASERDAAMRLVSELGPHAVRELRMAMIRAARAELDRPASEQRGEVALDYLFAVAKLRDARAVPLLVESLVYGPFVAEALAGFGDLPLPLILDLVSNPEKTVFDGVAEGLATLRYMVEDGTLGPDGLAEVTVAVRQRLTTPQRWPSDINAAMGTAVALGDPALLRIVERIASDSVAARGILGSSGEPSDLRRIQTEAQRLLDGGTPYPRRRPGKGAGGG
ncbi:MAG: hypothetical protein F4Z31_10030 [Gemmatimonadetes bacterium]|nr:hypothetical protein [Gemmatimonadota bacterium]MYJ09445.1 hypothetical protein [Gemmatimonadota bacterium]